MSTYQAKGVADTNMASLQSFTATGRPYQPKDHNDAYTSMMFADTFAAGSGPANLLPMRYTDDSILTIPVLPHNRPELVSNESDENDVKPEKSRGFFRKMSASVGRNKKKDTDFIMKEMTRGQYLKYYAKDDNGRFCGSEEPADDCILNDEDVRKYQKPLKFSNDFKKM